MSQQQNQIKRTESIRRFLGVRAHEDLAKLYTPAMECQVNVAQDMGEKIQGEFEGRPWHAWTDGITKWKSFRIPRNANTEPVDNDGPMTYDLGKHAEGIGMTGWDFKEKVSRWVAFDFDAIVGHSEKHQRGIAADEMVRVQEEASKIPWVTIRKSSGGKGLHIYVFLDPPVPTSNHTEHAALGRAILGKMSGLAGFNFESKADICGQNMWVWHRKMEGSGGLELVKAGGALAEVPGNWRDHVKVVSGQRKRNLPTFVEESESDNLADFFGQMNKTPLDPQHKALITWLEERKSCSWWDADNHMLVTHTFHLLEAHAALNLKGIFQSLSEGKDAPNDCNCFLYPLRRGGWVVRRYSMGVQEAPTWDQDGRGWTRCYFNCDPDLRTMARAKGGIESEKGSFVFHDADSAVEAARSLGANVPDLDPAVLNCSASLKEHKDGRLIVEIEEPRNRVAMPGWLNDKGKWKRLFNVKMNDGIDSDTSSYDGFVRHLSTVGGEDRGWVLKCEDAVWRSEPMWHVKAALTAMNLTNKEINDILGSSVMKCWKLVNRPFQMEFPGNREWNRDSAQFRFIPSQDRDQLKYPTWQKILKHAGHGLDEVIKTDAWAQVNGVGSGADYLKIWCASLFQEPYQPLPYLFFYSEEQDTGKSTFHEALSLLLTKGYTRADTALVNEGGFSGELENAILCVVEETDLSKAKNALNRIKDWVTAKEISVHPKGRTPYQIPNTTHWIQCANSANYCPTFPGDTRITMIRVPPLDFGEMIPKKDILPLLEKEAPDFLAALLAVEIPPSNSRLNVPILSTLEKQQVQDSNRNPLEQFIGEHCKDAPGYMLKVSDFYSRFANFADPADLHYWTKIRVGREFPHRYPKGRNPKDGQACYGNLAWVTDPTESRTKLKSTIRGNLPVLVPEDASA